MKIKTGVLALAASFFLHSNYSAQSSEQVYTIDDILRLTETGNPTLAIYKADIAVAKQQVEVAKDALLPSVNAGVQQYYLGNASVLNKDFSKLTSVDMPHYGSTFSADASQLLWKGGTVRNSIRIQSLREDVSELSYENSALGVKLGVVSNYLDLSKMVNQEEVYRQNIQLAEKRLENIQKFYKQGMVTRNDVIRGQLQLSNLNLALEVLENNRKILNRQLTAALGLPDGTVIKTDKAVGLDESQPAPTALSTEDVENHPAVLLSKKAVEIQDVNKKITRAGQLPSISAFAGNKLARPITSSSPAADLYSNGWSAGLAINWNVDSLYKTGNKLRQNDLEKERALAQQRETETNIQTAITAAYVKYNEALSQKKALLVNKNLAYENYRIMNSKYENQLAILLDLIDASNAKLDADLQYANAEINVVYSYYRLLKESGKL